MSTIHLFDNMVKISEIFKIGTKCLNDDKAITWTALAALAVKNRLISFILKMKLHEKFEIIVATPRIISEEVNA